MNEELQWEEYACNRVWAIEQPAPIPSLYIAKEDDGHWICLIGVPVSRRINLDVDNLEDAKALAVAHWRMR
jgi:hypothetical protein